MSLALTLSAESLRDVALDQGVCIRPVMHEVYDTVTGATQLIPRYGALGAALSTSLMEATNTIIQLWVVSHLLKTASRTTQGEPVR